MNGSRPNRIMIVDDHPLVRARLHQIIADSAEFELVAEAANVAEAREALRRHPADVAVVDLSLGRDDGLDLVRWIGREHPAVRILVLTMLAEALYAERLLGMGVQGYLMKSAAGSEFLVALRSVARGETYLSTALAERLAQRALRGTSARIEDPVRALTAREREISELIGTGTAVREIAGYLGLSVNTIDAHRSNIRDKLNLPTSRELGRYAMSWVAEHD